jgi:hypothetical protein
MERMVFVMHLLCARMFAVARAGPNVVCVVISMVAPMV